ncbi:exodeoxyribonuclease VII large subunit [Weissella oryzae SG25]|uniref:Exodeoxyribonuclease 7 small subunit n=1 Tax=Weissella oryzae (strain DSM 25784 / JCM 18191 / LMG 30913 / SG25) TaxID=1329250 RepID=A0A069CW27_WEIOS|nr:exodeoxyribonuclease VII small subunit [Weissella oryzae]GAK31423.1 exodeoxyribonuclease VII large subunit [Weissella oryzae SG25]
MAKNSFEDDLTTLEQIVAQLEKGDVPLEEALTKFEQGVKLSKGLQKTLQDAEQSLAKIVNEDGTVTDFKVED